MVWVMHDETQSPSFRKYFVIYQSAIQTTGVVFIPGCTSELPRELYTITDAGGLQGGVGDTPDQLNLNLESGHLSLKRIFPNVRVENTV